MEKIFSKKIIVKGVERTINVLYGDIRPSKDNFDLLICSSYYGEYTPTEGTMMCSLKNIGINVKELSNTPKMKIELDNFRFWVSKELDSPLCKYLGCMEIQNFKQENKNKQGGFSFMETILSYNFGFDFKRIALPLLGTGYMGIPVEDIAPMQIKAIRNSLKKNDNLIEVNFFSRSEQSAGSLVDYLKQLIFSKEYDVFVSHSSKQNDLALQVGNILRDKKVNVWVDKISIDAGDDYVDAIVDGISKSSIFLLLLSEEAQASKYVRKELKFAKEQNKYVIPYVIGDFKLNSSFEWELDEHTQRIRDKDYNLDQLADVVRDRLESIDE